MAGGVYVDGRRIDKPGTRVSPTALLEVRGQMAPYVSRGGLKLAGALDALEFDVSNAICMDVGASTGGFTDCLLQRGATKVFAVDVGYGQLAWKLRQDPRVVCIERTNIRTIDPVRITQPIGLVVADCSFISLTKVLPHIRRLLAKQADLVVLVKPQFEVGKGLVGKGGVVRDTTLRLDAIQGVRQAARGMGYRVRGGVDSSVAGPKGNVEYFLWLGWPSAPS